MFPSGRYLLHAVIDRIPVHSREAGVVDHFDDLLPGHFYFACGGVCVGEFAAVGEV
jgi:hypothetical protein